jgi:2-oxoisovalerate dehydrogenase E1 component
LFDLTPSPSPTLLERGAASAQPSLVGEPAKNKTSPKSEAGAPALPSPRSRGEGPGVRFIDAIKEGLYQSMEQHPNLILMGQDIAEYGGAFKIT